MIWDTKIAPPLITQKSQPFAFNLPLDLMRVVRKRAKGKKSISGYASEMMGRAAWDPGVSAFFPPLPPDAVVTLKRQGSKASPTRMFVPEPLLEKIRAWMARGYSSAYITATLIKYGMWLEAGSGGTPPPVFGDEEMEGLVTLEEDRTPPETIPPPESDEGGA